MIKNGIWHLI